MFLSIKTKTKVLALMLTIVALTVGQTAMAQGLYTATDGTSGTNESESYENLLDGDTGTKWCVTGFEPFDDVIFVEFETSSPIVPKGYTLTTANDTKENPWRNPSNWKILAKNDGDTDWTPLASVEGDNTMGAENFTPYDFLIINKNDSAYQKFRFEVTHLRDDNYETFQLSEFSFILKKNAKDLYQSTVEGLQAEYYYTGTAIDMSSLTLKDPDGNTIAPSNYTYEIKDVQGNYVTEVITPGMYRLIISPSSSSDYTSQKIFSFEVYPWAEGVTAGFCGVLNDYYGKEIYYTITDEEGVKTLTIKKNPSSPENSEFRMVNYYVNVNDKNALFAPWTTATPQYEIETCGTPETDDDYEIFNHYDFSCDIEKVVIEEGVTYIGQHAFYGCSDLATVIAPSTIGSIGDEAFHGTAWQENLPVGLVYVGSVAYHYKDSDEQPENVVFKDGTLSISEKLFYESERIKSVVIPASVKTIGAQAFNDCLNLKTVTIGAGVTSIDSDAFFNSENVTDVYCYANPENLTWYEDGCDDFNRGEPKTRCHVLPEYLLRYEEIFISTVNVDFEGDLPQPAVAKEYDGKYWATHYSSMFSYKLADAEKACAYTATFENNTLTLHKLGSVIPAGTAVVIVGAAGTPDMYIDNTATAEYTVSNDLKGVDVSTPLADLGEGTFYVLGKQDDNFGFYKYAGTNMPANKAYLQVTGEAPARGFNMVFDGETTEIRTTNYTNYTNSDAIHDLQGRKVSNPSKGLYIINGKKIVIK